MVSAGNVFLHLSWIAPLVLLIAFMSSPRFRGDIAESRVRRLLAAGLGKNLYTTFNDLVVPSGGGTTTIDHVIVSRFGIFVIESCFARGWISGTAVQAQWRQHRWPRPRQFDNPVHRNRLQLEALQRLLGTDERFKLTVSDQRFRQVSRDVVLEEGNATVVSARHGIERAVYVVVHVKIETSLSRRNRGPRARAAIRRNGRGQKLISITNRIEVVNHVQPGKTANPPVECAPQ